MKLEICLFVLGGIKSIIDFLKSTGHAKRSVSNELCRRMYEKTTCPEKFWRRGGLGPNFNTSRSLKTILGHPLSPFHFYLSKINIANGGLTS